MANIKIEMGHPVIDGMPLSFRAPCNCNEVNGIKVVWQDGDGSYFIDFTFADAHGNDLTGLGNLFSTGAMVRVVLDTTNAKAFIQNADTNAYLEGQLGAKVPKPAAAKVGEFIRVKSVDKDGNIVETETAEAATGTGGETGTITAIDFSNFESGTWTETVDGEVVSHTVRFDTAGRPSAIDGVTITWGDM